MKIKTIVDKDLSVPQINKEMVKVKKEIERTGKVKIGSRDYKTIEEYENALAEIKRDEMIFVIQRYISKIEVGATIAEYARAAEVSWSTFKKYVVCYQDTGDLPVHGNIGKQAWNKTTESDALKVVNVSTKIVNRVDKFAGEPVPTLMPLLFKTTMDQVQIKYPKIKISLSTFKRILKDGNVNPELKYETQLGKKLRKRLVRLRKKLEELKILKKAKSIELNQEACEKKILADKPVVVTKKKEVSKNRQKAKPGLIVQWDGSLDQFAKRTRVTRMQAIDNNTLATMTLSFVKNENNKGFQMLISQMIDNFGIPSIIMGDKRKGVDPTDAGALHAIVCKLLGISLNLDSNSIHKAELEALNGRMHPFVTYYSALNKIKTIDKLNEESANIIKASNEYFKREEADYSHLRQATEEVKEILRGKIKQVYIKSQDGIVVKKVAYQALDKEGIAIPLPRLTWSIVSLESNVPKKIWTDNGIFNLHRIKNKLEIMAAEKIFEMTEKHFIDNGVMILNRETYELLFKKILELGKKNAIANRSWRLDQQIQDKIEWIRENTK